MIERTDSGLIKDMDYVFNVDGSIAWRKMIGSEFLVIQKPYEESLTKKFGKPVNEIDKSMVEDRQLLILLGGIKKVLFLRGYTSLKQEVNFVSNEKCVCTCTITFIPNFETNMEQVTYSDVASASFSNTSGDIPQMFLEATAANRALVRCVRGFLNINIAGQDEIGPPKLIKTNQEFPLDSAPSGFSPQDMLARKSQELGLSFDQMKKASLNYTSELKGSIDSWKTFSDISKLDCFTLINKMATKK